MNLVLKTPDEAPYKTGKDFSVLISCEGSTAARTLEILQRLNRNLKHESGRLLYQLWNIDDLAFAELREMGAVEAARSDMIIIGMHAGQELPWRVEAWMKRWLDLRKGRPGALVAVLETAPQQAEILRKIILKLKAAAAAGQMDFFVTGAKVGRDEGMVRGAREVARQFVMAHHKGGTPGGLPAAQRLPAGICGR